jgi:hypothetical protein
MRDNGLAAMLWPMKEVHADLLLKAKPNVIVQAHNSKDFDVASYCVSEGWLEHVRDKDFGQAEYRITAKGKDALVLFCGKNF